MKKIFTILFFALLGLNNINAATFSSVMTGTWNASATWTITSGTDTDGIPDSNDDVTINTGHTISLTSANATFKSLLISSGAVVNNNGFRFLAYGNITNLGTMNGTLVIAILANSTFSSSSTYTCAGDWSVNSGTLTIAAGTTINKISLIGVTNGKTCSNFGNVTLSGVNTYTTGTWINNAGSSLTVNGNMRGNGTLNVSANSNTVTYAAGSTTIYPTTYYNLSTSSASTKSLTANLTVLNDLTFGAGATNKFSMKNFNISVGGNWTNNSNNTILNQGTITFNGSGTQTITRSTANEVINKMVVGGSGTVLLGKNIDVSTSLTINSGTFDLSASNYTVNVAGTLTNNGTINPRSGLFNFNGSAAQTINGTTNTQFYNLTLNNAAGLTINSAQSLKNILTVTTGNFNSNGNFTLISDATSTGIIGTSAGTFSGSMTIQRFIPNRSTYLYHDLSSPVQSTTIMDWDNELYMSGIGPNDGIAGPAGVDGNAGADSSVWAYNEPTVSWHAVTGSGTALVPGSALEIFVADNLTTWVGRAIDTKGTPNYGNQTVNLSYSAGAGAYAGLNLVGNPYAASVNYGSVTKTNMTGNVLILDQTGNYTSYGASPVIPPHQGFWVTASSAGASLVFTEASKSTVTSSTFYRTKPNYGIKLMFSSSMLPFYHENTINFAANGTLNYDNNLDALYMKSPYKDAPAIFMLTNNEAKLINNTINSEESEVSIPLGIFTPKEGVYNIEPSISNMNNYNYAWIENTKTGEKYDLNSTISITGEENKTNLNYVLRLSKKSINSSISQSIFNDDVIIFATENAINVKAINTNHSLSKVVVYDISGKLLIEQSNMIIEAGQTSKIDVSNLSTGVYIVNVTEVLGSVKTQKIIR